MSYCTRSDIESVYGAKNVIKWADMDGDQDADAITARVAKAIEVATARIDDRLRGGPYTLPISGDPATLVNVAAMLAGVWLYESRGVQDFSPETGVPFHRLRWHREQAERTLDEMLAGKIRLNVAEQGRGTSAPMVVRGNRDGVPRGVTR